MIKFELPGSYLNGDKMTDKNLPCWRCIHKEVCSKKETYEAFLDADVMTVFQSMPDFLDMKISCKHFEEPRGQVRTSDF